MSASCSWSTTERTCVWQMYDFIISVCVCVCLPLVFFFSVSLDGRGGSMTSLTYSAHMFVFVSVPSSLRPVQHHLLLCMLCVLSLHHPDRPLLSSCCCLLGVPERNGSVEGGMSRPSGCRWMGLCFVIRRFCLSNRKLRANHWKYHNKLFLLAFSHQNTMLQAQRATPDAQLLSLLVVNTRSHD